MLTQDSCPLPGDGALIKYVAYGNWGVKEELATTSAQRINKKNTKGKMIIYIYCIYISI